MTDLREPMALPEVGAMKRAGTKIVMVTAYDHPSARLASEAGIDLILVGDSAGNNVLGYDTTVPVSMDEAVMLTGAVARAKPRALVIGDMPFGSFQASDEEAVANAVRLVKAGADAVKLEGAGPMVARVSAIVGAGIPVMGHLGLTPQSATMLGGMKAQGATAAKARQLLADARALEAAGSFAIVLESVPARIAAHVTEALGIPTIGIGAGPACDGQVLVWHDLLGLNDGPTPPLREAVCRPVDRDPARAARVRGRRPLGRLPGRRARVQDPGRRAARLRGRTRGLVSRAEILPL